MTSMTQLDANTASANTGKARRKTAKAAKEAAKREKKVQRKLEKARKKAWKRARPEGAPWLSPILWVSDVKAATEFCEKAFGFTVDRIANGPDGTPVHAALRHRRGVVMLTRPTESWAAAPEKIHLATSTQYVYVADVSEIVVRATAAGAKLVSGPRDEPWGDRCATLVDLEGHTWMFATHLGKKAGASSGSSVDVAAPGSASSDEGEILPPD